MDVGTRTGMDPATETRALIAELRFQLADYIAWDAAQRKDGSYPWGPKATLLKADEWLGAQR